MAGSRSCGGALCRSCLPSHARYLPLVRLRSRIAGDTAKAFLSLTAEIAGGAFYAVFIHSHLLRLAVNLPQWSKVPVRRREKVHVSS
jgi:hypothetical protein